MKNPERMLAISGLSLVIAGALGIASPASAAQPAPQATEKAAASSLLASDGWDDDDYVVGMYSSLSLCQKAGAYGIARGAWSDFQYRIASIPGRGQVWILSVPEDNWRWTAWGGGWPDNWLYRPTYVINSYAIGGAYLHPFRQWPGVRFGPWYGHGYGHGHGGGYGGGFGGGHGGGFGGGHGGGFGGGHGGGFGGGRGGGGGDS